MCNSWIAIALAKARRNTEALFNTIGGGSSSNGSSSVVSSSRQPAPKIAFYSKYRKASNAAVSSHIDHIDDSCVSTTSSLKPGNIDIRKHSAADCYMNYDSESEFHQKMSKSRRTPSLMPPTRRMSGGMEFLNPNRSTLLINSNHHSRPSTNIHIRGQKSTQHISIMLFAVSIGFVILNLPFAIRTLFHRQYQEEFKVFLFSFLLFTNNK